MITLPVNCSVLAEEEMTYVDGGAMAEVFTYLFGNFFRDQVLSGVRSAVWNSLKQGSFTPMVSWYQTIDDMSLLGHLAFFIGCSIIYKQIMTEYRK